MFDKKEIIKKLIEDIIEKSLKTKDKAKQTARVDMQEAESAKVSRYNTTLEEKEYLANAFDIAVGDTMRGIQILKSLINEKTRGNSGVISIESVVETEDENGKVSFYMVLPYGGGNLIEHKGKEIFIITLESPICKALIGKKEGSFFHLKLGANSRRGEILSVY